MQSAFLAPNENAKDSPIPLIQLGMLLLLDNILNEENPQ